MDLSKRGIAVAILLAGCSGEIGDATPGDTTGSKTSANPTKDGTTTGTEDPEQVAPGVTPGQIVNDDGTITTVKADGSTVTVKEDGTVVSETPPTVTPEASVKDPDAPPPALGEDDTTTTPPTAKPSRCVQGTPEGPMLPRMTNRQYDNTVHDLLNVDLGLAASTLQADSKGNMDARSWQSYQDAAGLIASTIVTDTTARALAIPCTTADAACASQVISEFGAKVFRRPLTATEVTRFEGLFADTKLTETGSFDEQIQVVLKAMFQSPFFISVAELTEVESADASGTKRYALSDYELASRLSYMLWDTKPDQALTDAAAAGTLSQGTGLAEQATRMLSDARAKGLIERLHMDYLRMGPNTRWVGYTRDAAKYPNYNASQIDPLAQEALAVGDSVVLGGGTFAQLMTTTTGFVNADTAALYGLNPADYGAALQEAELGDGRPGLLTRAGFLAAYSYGNRTSPIHRGAFIMKDVLCTTLGDPSPNAASTPLPDDPSLVTNRDKTDAQTSIGADCKGCHIGVINPPGFALEAFDATGGMQTEDNGAAVNTTADVIVGSKTVHVTGAADLMAAIAAAPEAQKCYTENWVQVAYNRVVSPQDACTVDEIAAKMADATYSVKNLITDLATVDSFRFRAPETEVAQ
jgi:hypothetical protein